MSRSSLYPFVTPGTDPSQAFSTPRARKISCASLALDFCASTAEKPKSSGPFFALLRKEDRPCFMNLAHSKKTRLQKKALIYQFGCHFKRLSHASKNLALLPTTSNLKVAQETFRTIAFHIGQADNTPQASTGMIIIRDAQLSSYSKSRLTLSLRPTPQDSVTISVNNFESKMTG